MSTLDKKKEWPALRILVEFIILILLSIFAYKEWSTRGVKPHFIPPLDQTMLVIKKNDTLEKILKNKGVDRQVITNLLALGNEANLLKKLRPGQQLRLTFITDLITGKKSLKSLELIISKTQTLIVLQSGHTYEVFIQNVPLIHKIEFYRIIVQHSLSESIMRAHLPYLLSYKLITIFGGLLNFSRDIQKGDVIVMKVKNLYRDTQWLDIQAIIAVELIQPKHTYQAVLFRDKYGNENYYDGRGKSLQAAFLRQPVLRGRISSSFNLRRYQPILGITRPHYGTDFAAPYGTPIQATGNGTVHFVGWKGGYGRTVIVQHGSSYTTLYAHMSRYANHLHAGTLVKQGQIIGYIGSSGLATGAHVHYEMRINGQPQDPMKVKLPSQARLVGSELKKFLSLAEIELKALDTYAKHFLL